MTFPTLHFGPIPVDESAIVDFPEGLPGFEEKRRFVPLRHPTAAGLIFLQSLEAPGLCFLAVPVQILRPGYRLAMSPEDLDLLQLPPAPALGVDVNALAIVSLSPGEPPTANLRAPVVIHLQSRRAVQAIRPDDAYGYREPLAAPAEAVCS